MAPGSAAPLMDRQTFLAHSPGPDGKPQPLVDHLLVVAAQAALRASKFGSAPLGHWAGMWHDLGKFHPTFQVFVRAPEGRHGPDHSSAGAVLATEVDDLLAFPTAGHHAGLPSRTALKARLAVKCADRDVREALDIAARALPDLRPHDRAEGLAPLFLRGALRPTHELLIRMVFSALVDADYLDTERHFAPDRTSRRRSGPSLEALWERLEVDQARLPGRDASPLNRIRGEVYAQCVGAGEDPPGVFSLTVPTGGGKTRSGMAFALRHAVAHGLDRVIVAIPYTSIIEQTADVYRGIFGDGVVLEHHSAVDPLHVDDGARPDWARLASENWDARVVVTTTVQLFESLLAQQPSRCRKLHNIARSVIILDEVQTLPAHLLAVIVDVLQELVVHYGVTLVLCTATQPALTTTPHFRGFDQIREIVASPSRYFDTLHRVRYERPPEAWSWAQVAAELRAEPQVLAVVNTKRDALRLLDEVDDRGALHLSTLVCGAHRRDVLRDVRHRLATGGPCRLVSTQVVEAGVDLDFPAVFRAVGPLDRIVQAAGRCNREARRETGRVVVFEPSEGSLPRGAYRTGTETTRSLLGTGEFDFHDPAWYTRYFQRLYQARDLDERQIQPLRAALDYPEVAARFRLIEDDTVAVVVRYRGPLGGDHTVDE